jgi:hypothetical protein
MAGGWQGSGSGAWGMAMVEFVICELGGSVLGMWAGSVALRRAGRRAQVAVPG